GIRIVYGASSNISVQVHVATVEVNRILDCPATRLRIAVAGAKARKPRVLVVEPTGEAEGLEAGVGVECDVAELVVVDSLDDCASGRVNDQARAAEVITDNAVSHA